MNRREVAAYSALLAVMIIGVWAMAFTTEIRDSGRSGVALPFPDSVDDWQGDEIVYCLNARHNRVFLRSELDNMEACPECGAGLSGASPLEWSLLPADTTIHKKQYSLPSQPTRVASVVLSGTSRTSIHRPQICLVGDGNEIVRTRTISVEIPGRRPLGVTVLDMLLRRQLPDGRWAEYPSYYAYWFVSPTRETPSHYVRMFWMAFDQVFRGASHRWAYISVSSWRNPQTSDHLDEAAAFIAKLYPSIVRTAR
ncbi:MAG TPA: exosortase-associated EpsI family protein [Kiritimatiellia bacterium]|nr:exosortase-associated EpsI family protein [Kiritimatiellia bacterium]HMO98140.1 exosortase-associated EpsI family protein [Kiritimatiellia bacterium]HMP96196.1 exosortase-associated EpsI family protein [Kiritimatiellia bacterium]